MIEELNENSAYLTDDPDIAAKIDEVTNQCMFELARMKKCPQYVQLPVEAGDVIRFEDIAAAGAVYQLGSVSGVRYETRAAGTVLKILQSGTAEIDYYAWPERITESNRDSYSFTLSPDALEILPYGIAADLLKSDVSAEYGSVYDAYRQLMAEAEEYRKLNETKTGELTGAQADRLAELKAKNREKSYESAVSEAYARLLEQVRGSAGRFTESYNEKERRLERFQADVSGYSPAEAAIVQKAIDSGALNNTNRSHDFVDLVAKIGAEKGISFDFTDNAKLRKSGFGVAGATVNGFVTKNGVTVNMQSHKALETVVGHEITHVLEGTDLYSTLQAAVIDYAKGKGELNSRREALEKLYAGVMGANVDAELTADLVGEYLFTDRAFVQSLSTGHRNVFQKLYDEIRHLCRLATAGSKEARQLEKVKKAFEDAYRTTKNTADDGGVKYSLIGINEYGIEVYETSKEIMDMSWNERKARYLDVMKNEYRGRTAKFVKNDHTYYAQFDQSSIRKHIYGDKRASTNGVMALTKVGADGDVFTLVENADYTGSKQNTKDHTDADYFDYYVKTVQIDGKVFDLHADVERQYGTDSGYVYTLALRESKKTKAAPAHGTPQSGPVKGAGTASKTKISLNSENVNPQFSLSVENAQERGGWFNGEELRWRGEQADGAQDVTTEATEVAGGKETGQQADTEPVADGKTATQRADTEPVADSESAPDTRAERETAADGLDGIFVDAVRAQKDAELARNLRDADEKYEDLCEQMQRMVDDANRGRLDGNFQQQWDAINRQLQQAEAYRDRLQEEMDYRQRADSLAQAEAPVKRKASATAKEAAPTPAEKSPETTSPATDKDSTAENNAEGKKTAAQEKLNRVDRILQLDLEALKNKRDEQLQSLGSQGDFVRDQAGELYDEIYYHAKGQRVSKLLGELLDVSGGDWTQIKSVLANIKHNPDRQVNANSSLETLTRDTLRSEYESQQAHIEQEYSQKVSELENQAVKDRENVKIANQRREKMAELEKEIIDLVGDTSTWKDKPLGIMYQINTLRRNLREVVRDAKGNPDLRKADAIWEALQGKYNSNEAKLNREANAIKQKYAKMKITSAETVYIQMLGELKYNPECELMPEAVDEFYQKHKRKINVDKVNRIIETARQDYDSLLERVNAVLAEHGMRTIPHREGYFPHFTEVKQGWLAKLLNWEVRDDSIPTSIAGKTEDFKPNRSWQSFNKQRNSDTTDYNFTKGLDTYVHGALDWIYHIEDIQRRRAFENYIRYIHSEKGIQQRIDDVRANDAYDADQVQAEIDAIWAEAKNPLNNFVTDLRTGTNSLAGKKSSMDRGMEATTSRKSYSVMTNISNRVSANMVAGSISSALTNFIPITQSWGEVNPKYTLEAMKDTLRNYFVDDGAVDRSDFLTNRLRNEEKLYKTTWDKVSEKVGWMMEAVDGFTSQVVWRSKYLQNLKQGMGESDAMRDANNFSEGLMAGRSRGNMPTIFESKNPITKLFTAFQLEVANQYGYIFKDMPQNVQGKNAAEKTARLAAGYSSMMFGAYAYNALYSMLTGRDAALDPIGMAVDLIKDILGELDKEEEERSWSGVVIGLGEDVLQEVPFVGGVLGGGRVPISAAIPYDGIAEMISGTLKDFEDGDVENLTAEWLNLFYYGVMPMGGGQLRKTMQGLSMFDSDLPTPGSYTGGGDLRFPVEENIGSVAQAALFGQWASKNAQDYIEQGRQPLRQEQTEEFLELGISIADYWNIREDISNLEADRDEDGNTISGSKKKNVVRYIDALEMSAAQKVTLYSGQYESEKDQVLERLTADFDDEAYWAWLQGVSTIQSDKDENGKTVSGSRKQKIVELLNGLEGLSYGQKIVLYRAEFPSDDTYCEDIVAYLNEQDSLTYGDRVAILKALDFRISEDGTTVYWD